MVKTMRDVWDKGKVKTRELRKPKTFSPEIEKHYLDYLARKKAFLEVRDEITKTVADYESRLGDAGLSKI